MGFDEMLYVDPQISAHTDRFNISVCNIPVGGKEFPARSKGRHSLCRSWQLAARLAGITGAALALGACSFISGSGPTRPMIVDSQQVVAESPAHAKGFGYVLVHLDAETSPKLGALEPQQLFSKAFTDAPTPQVLVGVGDVLSVTVFESGAGGLFIPGEAGARAGNFVSIPSQQVERSGTIEIPYAGKILAAGRTLNELQEDIANRLAPRALEPQVVVSFTERHANEVSVVGDVTLALRFSMDASGETVLGAIARAEGPKFPVFETLVTIQRHGYAETARLEAISRDPRQNIRLQAGDIVYVEHEPRYFLALGANGQTTTLAQLDRRYPFGDRQITLADALALAGGLADDRANAKGVFLYRKESQATLAALGVAIPPGAPELVPTIYTLNLLNPSGFFFAGNFAMRGEDTIYVSNAPAADLTKFLNLLYLSTEGASNAHVLTQ